MVTPAQIVRRKRALRAKAMALGVPVPRGFNLVPFVGPYTRELIRRVQRKVWPKLAVTGEFDARMLALLFPPPIVTVGGKALGFAKLELGVKEHPAGSNRGPRVDQFEAACGIQGQPWCACFVVFCLREAGWKTTGWNQAYVPAWVAVAHLGQHGVRVIGSGEVRAGDLVAFDWEHNGVADHIGFCRGPVHGGEFQTIEGNTSAGSNSNGGEVQARTRSIGDVACFMRVSA